MGKEAKGRRYFSLVRGFDIQKHNTDPHKYRGSGGLGPNILAEGQRGTEMGSRRMLDGQNSRKHE